MVGQVSGGDERHGSDRETVVAGDPGSHPCFGWHVPE